MAKTQADKGGTGEPAMPASARSYARMADTAAGVIDR